MTPFQSGIPTLSAPPHLNYSRPILSFGVEDGIRHAAYRMHLKRHPREKWVPATQWRAPRRIKPEIAPVLIS